MPQRHEHLARPLAPLVHVVLYNSDSAGVTVLVPQPLEDPLRGVPLLGQLPFIFLQDPIDDPNEWIQTTPSPPDREARRVLEVDEIKTIPGTPRSHAFVERLIGTVRREYLDRIWVWNQSDLERKLEDYKMFYNQFRCHTGLTG